MRSMFWGFTFIYFLFIATQRISVSVLEVPSDEVADCKQVSNPPLTPPFSLWWPLGNVKT